MISRSIDHHHVPIMGTAHVDRSTKKLLMRIPHGAIAVIAHDDLDELAVQGLLQAKVKAVINAGRTMSGRIPSSAVLPLLDAEVPIYEMEPVHFDLLEDEPEIVIANEQLMVHPYGSIPCRQFTRQDWFQRFQTAKDGEAYELKKFVENTLRYAELEKEFLFEPLKSRELRTSFRGRSVVVVVRGSGYQADLVCLHDYIQAVRPVLVGVDGGADALLEQGYQPDVIVGDMDSVSDKALRCGAELVVHGYRSGAAPGLVRLEPLGLQSAAVIVACGGTSEDLALLLAYDHQCEEIVTVGLHSHMHDFLEKGRNGMGSTWLVRMKVGNRLMDAKGISRLFPYLQKQTKPWPLRAQSLLDKLKPKLILPQWFRRESEPHGTAHIRHHSRLE
ncbi:putative cytokinetic ring protein SteA [Paenibacillus cremeus]|uniref:putative cytokinetic ring protein SteA n=1 Tax=Paenibacillus cremeus TaxID=2163881 RepID=UPI00164892FA|nr:putative cytokinetic ring protein SteA [Paenibacillus cremeus]